MKNKKMTNAFIICVLLIITILPPIILSIVGVPFLGVKLLFNPHNGNRFITAVNGTVVDYEETLNYDNDICYYEIYECKINDTTYSIKSNTIKPEVDLREIGETVELYYYTSNDNVTDIDVTTIFFWIGIALLILAVLEFCAAIPFDIIFIVIWLIGKRLQKTKF